MRNQVPGGTVTQIGSGQQMSRKKILTLLACVLGIYAMAINASQSDVFTEAQPEVTQPKTQPMPADDDPSERRLAAL